VKVGGRLLSLGRPLTRQNQLRDAVRTGPLAAAYAVRWSGEPPPPEQFVDMLVEYLFAAIDGAARDAFTAFVTAAGRTKWIIAADFCIADDTRPNDVFAFTVFPYDASLPELMTEIASVFPNPAEPEPMRSC
jgi:hypothetical protein